MRMLRTPEDRFADLPDFDLEPGYAEVPDGEGGSPQMAYVAEHPDRVTPTLLPTRPDGPAAEANRAALATLRELSLPLLCPFSDGDPITAAMAAVIERTMPGAAGRDHPTITDADRLLQEDAGPELAKVVADFVRGS